MMDDKERGKRFKATQRAVLKTRTAIQRDAAKEITRLLKVSLDKITVTLANQPSDYQQWALPQLKQSIQRTLHELSAKANAAGEKGMTDAWGAGKDLIDVPLDAAGVNIQGMAQSIDARQLFAMREFMTGRISDISLKAMNRINSELGLVMTGVQSPGEAIGAITRVFKETSRRRALTIVRTELGRAFSIASHERSVQARDILPGLKKQWRRSGKTHSRPAHDAADGQIREVDKPFSIGIHQLMHPHDPAAPASETINCGCVALDYMAHWEMLTPGAKPVQRTEDRRQGTVNKDVAKRHSLKSVIRSPSSDLPTRKARRVVAEYERKFANLPVEHAVVISKSGEVLVEKAGTEMRVIFTDAELRKMKGATVLHNHLDVASFSKHDIATAATQQVAEMRVVDEAYSYTMKPPKGGWNFILWKKTIEPAMVNADSTVLNRIKRNLASGKITGGQYDADYQHEVWKEVARKIGITYRRQRRRKQ